MRIVSGGRWTIDGRWVVVAHVWGDFESIVFDPDNGDPWMDLHECIAFRREHEETST